MLVMPVMTIGVIAVPEVNERVVVVSFMLLLVSTDVTVQPLAAALAVFGTSVPAVPLQVSPGIGSVEALQKLIMMSG
jgi:hypothetical protein